MITLIVVCSLSIAVLWKLFSIWYGRRLRKDTERRLRNVERMKKEIRKLRKKKTEKKPKRKQKETPDFLGEENLENLGIPSSAIQDEKDNN